MRKTSLRTLATHQRYVNDTKDPTFMETAPSVVEYQYWRIIDNTYPYDAIAKTHRMLVPKRKFAEYKDMKRRERLELDIIINNYIDEYDCLMLNLPHRRTVLDWFHYHLLIYK